MIGRVGLFAVLAFVAVQAYPNTPLHSITLKSNFVEEIKNIIQHIQDNIKYLNEQILAAVNDFINQIKNSIKSAEESKIQKLIEDQINKELQTRKGVAQCFEDSKPAMKTLAEEAKKYFKQCGENGLNVGKELAGEVRALIKQCLNLVTQTLYDFGNCLLDFLQYEKCFKEAIAAAQQRADDIKTAGEQLGVDFKDKIKKGAEDFRVCWRGGYDFIYEGVERIVQDIEKCAQLE